MDRPKAPQTRTLARDADTRDLASVISAALAASPIDIRSLRRGVWTYVGEERHAGTSPGPVIFALTELIDSTPGISKEERARITKRVILWTVEAFFGQLGGELAGSPSENDAPRAMA